MENFVMKEEVVIVGGGVAGLATAVALNRVGVRSLVLEKANELRVSGPGLTLFSNAWIALESLGGGVDGTGLRTVHRRALLEALLEELPTDTVRFSSKLLSIEKTKTRLDNDSFGVIIHLEDRTTIHTKVLIGCDGVHSLVSKWLGLKDVANSGRCAMRGLGVFPEGHGLNHEMHQFVDIDAEMAKGDPKVIQKTMLENVSGSPQVVKDVIQQSDMQSDAMHPMTHDLGQGGCSALEDAVVLGRHIRNSYIRNGGMLSQEDLEVEIEMYVKERRWRTAGLITASYLSGWLMKFLPNTIYYKIIYPKLGGFLHYDCGKLVTYWIILVPMKLMLYESHQQFVLVCGTRNN
ncbi:hypothetical protein MKX01_011407 [Papaver californicum]|nr:hypothetical protein MKX01_011407 [Papaver californicum]